MAGLSAREEILRLFRSRGEGYLSGGELSRTLGVSRTAVWKQIKMLRDLGYTIEAVPSRGYRLAGTPDTLVPEAIQAGLETGVVGREVVFYPVTDSTNLRARDLADQGAVEGTVVIADRQTAGKGRRGRHWVSPPGVNLYLSLLLRPSILPYFAPQLTFLGAVAVALSIAEVTGLDPKVKWPNDVLVHGRKVAGLLSEMDAETEGVRYVILGIGVNINIKPDQFPGDLRYPATSLAVEKGAPVSRQGFARALCRHLDALYARYLEQGFGPLMEDWKARFAFGETMVEVDCEGRLLRGTVAGLDEDGALLLRLENGAQERILAGDVRPV